MEVLVLDGKDFVKASKAARDLGYTTDYIGQLCRSGQVDAHLIGRTWYVNADTLGQHKVEKKRSSRIKAKESAHRSIEEHRLKIETDSTRNNYNNIAIQYETDSEELIPEPKKLKVANDRESKFFVGNPNEYSEETVIENKGKTVIMSGNLQVVDVTDAPMDSDTIVLKPGKIAQSIPTKPVSRALPVAESIETNDEAEIEVQKPNQQPDFISKLIQKEVVTSIVPQVEEEQSLVADNLTHRIDVNREVPSSVLPYVIALILLALMTTLSLPLKAVFTYQYNAVPQTTEKFEFEAQEAIAILQSKI